jgi:hypothetical protein
MLVTTAPSRLSLASRLRRTLASIDSQYPRKTCYYRKSDQTKNTAEELFDLTNGGREFVRFICCESELEANDGEVWAILIARLVLGIQKSSLFQVILQLYTVDPCRLSSTGIPRSHWSSENFNALSLYSLDETSPSVKTKLIQLRSDVTDTCPLLEDPEVIAAFHINGAYAIDVIRDPSSRPRKLKRGLRN